MRTFHSGSNKHWILLSVLGAVMLFGIRPVQVCYRSDT